MESNGESNQAFLSYQDSVHGRAVEKGSQKAAVCTDCHGAHSILPASDARSPISRMSVPATCGKCHTEIENTFNQSIHGQAIARGNQLAPVARIATGSTRSSRMPIPTRRPRSRISRAIHARAATRACGCARSLACREAA